MVEVAKPKIGFWKGTLIVTGTILGVGLLVKGIKYVVDKVQNKKVEDKPAETECETEGTNE